MIWIRKHIYYQIKEGQVTGTYVEKDTSVTKSTKAFSHPRTVIGNFRDIESCFISIAQELAPRRFFTPAHIAIVQFMDDVEGGLTDIEVRALREAALGAGSRGTYIPLSKNRLSKQQILDKTFKELDGV